METKTHALMFFGLIWSLSIGNACEAPEAEPTEPTVQNQAIVIDSQVLVAYEGGPGGTICPDLADRGWLRSSTTTTRPPKQHREVLARERISLDAAYCVYTAMNDDVMVDDVLEGMERATWQDSGQPYVRPDPGGDGGSDEPECPSCVTKEH